MRKVLSLLALISVFAMVLTFAACGDSDKGGSGDSGSPEDMVKAVAEAMFEGDADTIMGALPEFVFDDVDKDEVKEELQDMLDQFMELSEEYEFDYSIEVKRTKDKSKDLIEEIEEEFDLSEKDLKSIEEAAKVEMTMTIEVEGEEDTTEEEVLCVLIDGEWYMLNPGMFGDMLGF